MKTASLFLAFTCLSAQQRPAGVDSLRQFSASLEGLASHVNSAVVQIFSSGYALSDNVPGSAIAGTVTRQRASGTGVILSAEGDIITNAHVVANARRVRVRVPASSVSGRSIIQPEPKLLDARVLGVDTDTDLALVKIERAGLSHLDLDDSDKIRQGQLVLAFGNPLGMENSVSMGVISSVARQIKPDDTMIYIQTDAPINPGNSGGPLVNVDGRVVGINTFILSQSGGSEGIGFAIPSNIVSKVWTELRDKGHVHRSDIGVTAQTITPAMASGLGLARDRGVVVADVQPLGPGANAGVKVGDIVLSLDSKPMENARQMQINMYRYSAGQTVTLELLRGEKKVNAMVSIVNRHNDPMRFADLVNPAKNLVPKLGILGISVDRQLAALLDELRNQYGVVVAAKAGESTYAGDGLILGDVIYSVNTLMITSIEALNRALDDLKDEDPLVLQVQRGDRLLFLTLQIE